MGKKTNFIAGGAAAAALMFLLCHVCSQILFPALSPKAYTVSCFANTYDQMQSDVDFLLHSVGLKGKFRSFHMEQKGVDFNLNTDFDKVHIQTDAKVNDAIQEQLKNAEAVRRFYDKLTVRKQDSKTIVLGSESVRCTVYHTTLSHKLLSEFFDEFHLSSTYEFTKDEVFETTKRLEQELGLKLDSDTVNFVLDKMLIDPEDITKHLKDNVEVFIYINKNIIRRIDLKAAFRSIALSDVNMSVTFGNGSGKQVLNDAKVYYTSTLADRKIILKGDVGLKKQTAEAGLNLVYDQLKILSASVHFKDSGGRFQIAGESKTVSGGNTFAIAGSKEPAEHGLTFQYTLDELAGTGEVLMK